MIRKFLLKQVTENPTNKFTHYWTNDGENFPDIEDFEKDYIEAKFAGDYQWVETDIVRPENNSIQYIKLELRSAELKYNKFIFLKIEDGEYIEDESGTKTWTLFDIPRYYYCVNYKYISDENYPEQTYEAMCELDMWATFGCRMHAIMKNCDEPILFKNKMCDRFLRHESGKGYWIDYLKQPWLRNIASEDGELYRYEDEPNLSYTDWLYINSGSKEYMTKDTWMTNVWIPWTNKQLMARFETTNKWDDKPSGITTATSSDVLNYYQNIYAAVIQDKLEINEEDYNANGKYKWLITRTGNNTVNKDASTGVSAMFKYYKNASVPIQRLTYGDTINNGEDWQPKFLQLESSQLTFTESIISDYILTFNSNEIPVVTQQDIEGVESLIFAPETKLFENSYIKLEINNKTVYINNMLEKALPIEEYLVPFGVSKLLCEFNTEKVYIPSLEKTIEFTPSLWFTINTEDDKTKSVTFTFSFVFEESIDSLLDMSFPESITLKSRDVTIDDTTKSFLSFELLDPASAKTNVDSQSFVFNGEQLMMIPIRKGLTGQEWIKKLNNSNYIILSDELTLGMPINDIPPTVLSVALRRYSTDSSIQAYGDLISVRNTTTNDNPTDFVALTCKHSDSETAKNEDWAIPVIFNSLDYIPVTIAISPSYNKFDYIIGGSAFLNAYYRMLVDVDSVNSENTIDNEPAMFNPHLWQWIYWIDGKDKISITGDMIDTRKLVTKNWDVKMNINMVDVTNYRLDISEIKNDAFPYTKSFMELIASDSTTHPYSTEEYNNWLAQNQVAQETSKNADLTIPNQWARTNMLMNIPGNLLGSVGGGAAAGGKIGGPWGALIGAAAGLVKGGVETGLGFVGLDNKIKMAEQEWNNKWDGLLGNKYSAPAKLNPSGFSKGSLIYSDIDYSDTKDYSLMRTFKPNNYNLSKIWDNIATDGYPYMAECKYNEYDNRKNFNVINCNPSNKKFFFKQTLYDKMRDISTLFSNENAIEWYIMKCISLIRLFHAEYSIDKLNELIKGNVEHKSYTAFIKRCLYDTYDNISQFPRKTTNSFTNGELTDYELSSDKLSFKKKVTKTKPFEIYYKELDVNITNFEKFKSNYVSLGGDTFASALKDTVYNEDIGEDVVINSVITNNLYSDITGINVENLSIGNSQTGRLLVEEFNNWAVVNVYAKDASIHPTAHNVGYEITITPAETFMTVEINELDEYVFDEKVSGSLYWSSGMFEDFEWHREGYKQIGTTKTTKITPQYSPCRWTLNSYVTQWSEQWMTRISNWNDTWDGHLPRIGNQIFINDEKKSTDIKDVRLILNENDKVYASLHEFNSEFLKLIKPYTKSMTYNFRSNFDVTWTSASSYPTGETVAWGKDGIISQFSNLKTTNKYIEFSCDLDFDNNGKLIAKNGKLTSDDTSLVGSYYKRNHTSVFDSCARVRKQFNHSWKLEDNIFKLALNYSVISDIAGTSPFYGPIIGPRWFNGYSWQNLNNDLRITYNATDIDNQKDVLSVKFYSQLTNVREEYKTNFLKLYFIRKI